MHLCQLESDIWKAIFVRREDVFAPRFDISESSQFYLSMASVAIEAPRD
jgi:hypothetical protein